MSIAATDMEKAGGGGITPAVPEVPDRAQLRKTIVKLALPITGENLLRMMVMVADTAIVGRLGAEAVAVVGLTWAIIFFFMMITFGLNHGASAVVARYIGAKDKTSAAHAGGQAIFLNFLMACGISALLITQAENLFRIMGAEAKLIEQGAFFLRTLGSIYIADALMVSANTVLRAAGDTKTPLIIVGTTNIITVLLEIGLVYGYFGLPAYGLMGSAMAISSVRIFSMFLAFGGLLFGWYRIKVTWRDIFPPNSDMIGKVMKISWPSIIEQVVYSLASVGFVRIISGLGTIPLAIHNILMRSESFSFMPGMSFSMAGSILVGQSLGEKNKAKAGMVGWEATKLCMWIMSVVGLLFFLFPVLTVKIFTSDPAVLNPTAYILMMIAFIEPIQGLLFGMMGAFKGAGDTKTTMMLSLVGMWLVRVPFAYLFAVTLGAGVGGAWAAMCLHIGVVALWGLHHFRKGTWRDIEV